MGDRVNEFYNKKSEIREIDKNLNKVCNSICKIEFGDNNFGTGFLIKLIKNNQELFCLMTNEHVIKKEMIELKESIQVKYNYEEISLKIKLDKNERFIKYDKKMDITIVEILENDNVDENIFLLPNISEINFILEDIFIPQFPRGSNLSFSKGKIKNMNMKCNELYYDASTISGSSGSPIFFKNCSSEEEIKLESFIFLTQN